jgi:pullulanase
MQMLTGGILAVSQGVLFYNGGVELARTKGGNHNSYNAGDEVNQIQWERKGHFADLFNFHKGAIALRRDHPLFRLSTAEEVRKRLKFHDQGRPAAETIVFTVDGEGLAGEEWKQAAVFINPTPQSQTFVIPSEEEFGVYVLDTRAGTDMLQTVRGEIVVGPRSMAVLGR